MGRTLRFLGALALASGILAAPHLGAAQTATGWPTFHGGPNRDGAANVSGPTAEFFLNKFMLSGSVTGGPVVSGSGRVFIGDSTGTLYAFDVKSNASAPVWTYNTNSPIGDTPGLTPDGQTVIVGSDNGSVVAINTSNGAKRWSATLDGPVRASPVVSPDGSTVYVASVNGTINAMSTSSGSAVWSKPIHLIAGTLVGSPTLNPSGSILYVSTSAEQVIAFPSSGTATGTPCYTDSPVSSSPAVDQNGNIYVMSDIGTIWSFDSGCNVRWSRTLASHTLSRSTPAIGAGVVITANTNGNVYAWSQSDGTGQWTKQAGNGIYASPAIATGNNQVYIGSGDGNLYAFATSGQLTWSSTRRLGTGVGSPALAPDGTVWVATDDGSLYHIGNVLLPPTVLGTATPGPSPIPSATPSITSTPSSTSTPTAVTLSFTMKPQVAGGQKQTITIHSAPNTAVTLRVQYPNGDHHTGHVTTDASGNAVHNFTQPDSKIQHNRFTATVTVSAGTGSARSTQTGQYKILFGPVDASAEPRTQKVGGTVQIYVHARAGTHVRAHLSFPNGTSKTFNQTAGPKGWGHWRYKVSKGLTRGSNKTVKVTGSTVNAHPNHSTQTSFTIK
jgi:outer membrane protein assembly factor BamB